MSKEKHRIVIFLSRAFILDGLYISHVADNSCPDNGGPEGVSAEKAFKLAQKRGRSGYIGEKIADCVDKVSKKEVADKSKGKIVLDF